jgi:hypothetical protein
MTAISSPRYVQIDLLTGEIVGETDTPALRKQHRGEIFEALAKCCGMTPEQNDWTQLTAAERGILNRFSKQLVDVHATVDDLDRFLRWWNVKDWRGQRGQKPTPADVVKCWTAFRSSTTDRPDRFEADWLRYKAAHPEVLDDDPAASTTI